MKNKIPKRKRVLLRERTLHRIREAHRLSRLNVTYNPNKLIGGHSLRINRDYNVVEPKRGKIIIPFPRKMDFRENLEETLEFYNILRKEILHGVNTEVMLDHKDLEKITPEAAVILFAEIQRSLEYKSSMKRVRGNYPDNAAVATMLTDIGFFSSLNIRPPKISRQESSRLFFKVVSGNKTDSRIADRLVKHFEKVLFIDPIARKRLLSALVECMDNVHSHAYKRDKDKPDLLGEWWMAGFIDKEVGQVAFIFFDQGVGVPTTLKEKWSVKIKKLVGLNDGELIKHAVLKGITRKDSRRHGNGFPSFKDFINELAEEAGGFLRVISKNGDYSYCKHTKTNSVVISKPLNGSLLIWSLQPEKEIVGNDGRIDLSSEGLQARLSI